MDEKSDSRPQAGSEATKEKFAKKNWPSRAIFARTSENNVSIN